MSDGRKVCDAGDMRAGAGEREKVSRRETLVRGTPTAGVLLHWVIISRRWERNQKRDSE